LSIYEANASDYRGIISAVAIGCGLWFSNVERVLVRDAAIGQYPDKVVER
jgi:hypothetical protein